MLECAGVGCSPRGRSEEEKASEGAGPLAGASCTARDGQGHRIGRRAWPTDLAFPSGSHRTRYLFLDSPGPQSDRRASECSRCGRHRSSAARAARVEVRRWRPQSDFYARKTLDAGSSRNDRPSISNALPLQNHRADHLARYMEDRLGQWRTLGAFTTTASRIFPVRQAVAALVNS
jgi:hypothetical protein